MRFFAASLFKGMLIIIFIDSRLADKFRIFTSFEVAVKRVLAVFLFSFLQTLRPFFYLPVLWASGN